MKKKTKYFLRRFILSLIFLFILGGVVFAFSKYLKNDDISNNTEIDQNEDKKDEINNQEVPKEPEKPKKQDIEITLSAVGDIMFHPREITGGYDKATDSYNYKPYFEPIKSIIESSDFAIGNYEGTVCGNDIYEYQGYPLFNAPDEVLDALKYTGFDLLSTVNNHSLDTRKVGVQRTIDKLDARGILHVGTYKEKPQTRVVMADVKGIKIAFLAYSEMFNGLDSVLTPEEFDYMVNKLNEEKIKEDVAYAKQNQADLIVMIVHWGDEYIRSSNSRQKAWADFMFKEGIDVIFGSHPHVIQESEELEYNGKKVFVMYSSGNFISNQRTEEELPAQTEDGVIITLNIKKDAETEKTTIEGIKYTPTWVYRARQEGKSTFTYRILPIKDYIESDEYTEKDKARMQRSYRDTMSKLDKNFSE